MAAMFAAILFAAAAFVAFYETPDGSDAAAGDFQYEYNGVTLEYTVTSSTAPLTVSVIGYVGTPADVIIPDTVTNPDDGLVYSVTAVGYRAFVTCASLKTIDFGNSVETIGKLAFHFCPALKTVDFGSVTAVGDQAFSVCISLETLDFGNVETIGNAAFEQCTSLITIEFRSVETIGDEAFLSCSILKTVDFGNSVVTVGNAAFMKTSLITADLGDMVETIGSQAFESCSALTTVDFGNRVEVIALQTFYECLSLETVDLSNVKTIGEWAFSVCLSLETVDLGSVETIKDWAFENCYALESVTIDGSADIRTDAFLDCDKIRTVTVTGNNTTKVIQTYFSNGGSNWYLPGATSPAEYLFLDDLDSTVYDPNGIPGIAGDTGRKLWFGADSAAYEWDTGSSRWIAVYTVTLTAGQGISGFAYGINGSPSTPYTAPFTVNKGDLLVITATMRTGYEFRSWSSSSTANPLTIQSVSGAVTLTADGVLKEYTVTFDSGPEYTVFIGGSPVHSAVTVSHGDDLTFSIRVSAGYIVRPSLSGTADISLQTNGWYRIQNVQSNVHVNILVQPDGSNGGGSGTGGGSGSGGGQGGYDSGGGSGGGSDTGEIRLPYWVPVLIIAAILGCMFLLFIIFRRRKDEEEE
jgi:uncharacterized membrane protein YgcG